LEAATKVTEVNIQLVSEIQEQTFV